MVCHNGGLNDNHHLHKVARTFSYDDMSPSITGMHVSLTVAIVWNNLQTTPVSITSDSLERYHPNQAIIPSPRSIPVKVGDANTTAAFLARLAKPKVVDEKKVRLHIVIILISIFLPDFIYTLPWEY